MVWVRWERYSWVLSHAKLLEVGRSCFLVQRSNRGPMVLQSVLLYKRKERYTHVMMRLNIKEKGWDHRDSLLPRDVSLR